MIQNFAPPQMTLPLEGIPPGIVPDAGASVEADVLSRGATKLLAIIRRFLSRYGKFYASQRFIGDLFHRTTRTIRRWTEELVKMGWIKTKRRAQNTLLYQLLTRKMSAHMSAQMSAQMSGRLKDECNTLTTEHCVTKNPFRKPAQRSRDPHAALWAKYGV